MAFSTGEMDIGSGSILQLQNRQVKRPFYDTGQVVFFDDFESDKFRGSRSDNNPANNGMTVFSSLVSYKGTKSLLLRSPGSGFNDYTFSLDMLNSVVPFTSDTNPAFIGLECALLIVSAGGQTGTFGMSLERWDGVVNGSTQSEWRAEYDLSTDNWYEVTGNAGGTRTALFTSHLMQADDNAAGNSIGTEYSMWHHLKLVANMNAIGAGSFAIFSGADIAKPRFALAAQTSRSTKVTTVTVPPSIMRAEFHCTGGNTYFYIGEMWITVEPKVPASLSEALGVLNLHQ